MLTYLRLLNLPLGLLIKNWQNRKCPGSLRVSPHLIEIGGPSIDKRWFSGLQFFMKTTLDLPDDLVLELKLRSAHERRKLKEVAAAALRRGLGMKEIRSTPRKGAIRLPFFEGKLDAPSTRMTAEELIALEQKVIETEDLKRAGVPL